MAEIKRCIHDRTYKQKCAKCFRCVICLKPLNRSWDEYTVDYEGDVAHESCVKKIVHIKRSVHVNSG